MAKKGFETLNTFVSSISADTAFSSVWFCIFQTEAGGYIVTVACVDVLCNAVVVEVFSSLSGLAGWPEFESWTSNKLSPWCFTGGVIPRCVCRPSNGR